MMDPATADVAAEQILAGMTAVLGLHADAARLAMVRPLAAALLRQGASLTSTVDPILEPLAMGGTLPDTLGTPR